jgi:hypothetical protein
MDAERASIYQMAFQTLSVSGTLKRATAVYRVTSFRRYDRGGRRRHMADVGKLLPRNGIVTNTLTRDFFCSDPFVSLLCVTRPALHGAIA